MEKGNDPGTAPQAKSVRQQMAALHADLRVIAGQQMEGERADHMLQEAALISEAYLILCKQRNLEGASRAVFLAAAVRTMHRVLVNHAREKRAQKRGGGWKPISLGDADRAVSQPPVNLLDLNEAMDKLERHSSRLHNVVVRRYFAGMTMGEIAEALVVEQRIVEDDWAVAKAWLRREMAR